MIFYLFDRNATRVAQVSAASHVQALAIAKDRGIHAPMVQSDRDIAEQRARTEAERNERYGA